MDALTSMCYTWRHDFGLMSPEEQEKQRTMLSQLYVHHVKPLEDKIQELESKKEITHDGKRVGWATYWMSIAEMVASRSTCLRRKVGAVAVIDKRILATGYNGAPSGLSHCEDIGCLRIKNNIASGQNAELCRASHSEQNLITQCAMHGISMNGCTVYVTCHPCVICAKMLIQVGCKKIVYKGDYPDELSVQMLKESNIWLYKMDDEK